MLARTVRFALGMVMLCGGVVVADQTPPAATAPAAPAAAPAPRKPLMAGLDAIGLAKPMDDLNLNVYGFIQGGYFYDFNAPHSGSGPTNIGLNGYKNSAVLDKIDLSLERTVDPTKKQFDLGFHVEGLYGADAALIHSSGIGDTQTDRNQWDLLQAYVDIAAPGIPFKLRVGKWIELAGFEHFSANIYGAFGDPSKGLYSYSYQFLYAEPGTQTGILGTYVVNDQLTIDLGGTLGWNQSLRDSNGDLDFLGRITWNPTAKTAVTFVMTEGPEFPPGVGHGLPKGDNHDWWTALDLVITHKVNDNLMVGLGMDYINAPHIPGFTGAQNWGGLAGYVSYVIDPRVTFNGRVEWFHDNGFFTGSGLGAANFYEATLGLAIKPLPNDPMLSNLLIRPELRYDWCNKRAFDNTDRGQFSFSIDVLFTF